MTIFGLPTRAATQLLKAQVADIKSQLIDAREEATTGRAANISKAVDGDIGEVQQVQRLVDRANSYELTIQSVNTDLDTAQLVLGDAIAGVAGFAVAVEGAVETDDAIALDARAQEAENRLTQLFTKLNSSIGGRYLFAGAAVDTPPLSAVSTLTADISAIISAAPDAATAIADLDAYFETPGAGFDTAVYQGSTSPAAQREVADGERMGVSVTAIDQGLKDLMRGFATVALADVASSAADQEALYRDGVAALARGEASVQSTVAAVGGDQQRLDYLESANAAQRFLLEETFNALTSKDDFEAATRMRELENQLEASFLTAARIAQLSLVNFLR